jgi:hypothetical protein
VGVGQGSQILRDPFAPRCEWRKVQNKPTQASVSEDMKVQKQTHCFACGIGESPAVSRDFLDAGENVRLIKMGVYTAPLRGRLAPVRRAGRKARSDHRAAATLTLGALRTGVFASAVAEEKVQKQTHFIEERRAFFPS